MESPGSVLCTVAGSLSVRLHISMSRQCVRPIGAKDHELYASESYVSTWVTATHEGAIPFSYRFTPASARSIQ
jgi:hypothetical protein